MTNVNRQSIEIDCAPGSTRPGDLLPIVIDGLNLIIDADKPNSMIFGNWTWIIPEDQTEQYLKVKDTVKSRITELYNQGSIRYGSW